MVDEISALGLRHVGYAVPVEFFGPFVNACVETLSDKVSVEVLDTGALRALADVPGVPPGSWITGCNHGEFPVVNHIQGGNEEMMVKLIWVKASTSDFMGDKQHS